MPLDLAPGKANDSAVPRRISARRRIAAVVLTLAIIAVFGIIGFELALRAFVPVTDVAFNIWDPAIGLRRKPGSVGRYISGGFVNAPFHFNAQGWNHPRDYTVTKPPGVRRVCIVGDSQIEALQVAPDQSMAAVAERIMNRPGRPVEWYAFGASGWGTAQELECIRRYALEYAPDVVVLLFVQNDPFDTSPYIADIEPYFVTYYLDGDESLTLVFPQLYEPSLFRRLSAKSAIVRYFMVQKQLDDKLVMWLSGQKLVGGVNQLPLRERIAGLKYQVVPGVERLSHEQRQEMTWKLIEKLLAAARDECARRGARFAVAFRGWSNEIDAPVTGEIIIVPPREADPYALVTRASEMGREWVGPICSRLNIPYLDLTSALQDRVRATGQRHRFPDDNHYNQLGHQAAGEALAKWVDELLQEDSSDLRNPGLRPADQSQIP